MKIRNMQQLKRKKPSIHNPIVNPELVSGNIAVHFLLGSLYR